MDQFKERCVAVLVLIVGIVTFGICFAAFVVLGLGLAFQISSIEHWCFTTNNNTVKCIQTFYLINYRKSQSSNLKPKDTEDIIGIAIAICKNYFIGKCRRRIRTKI